MLQGCWHDTAASAAIASTKQFLDDLATKLSPAQLKALLGAGPTLAFAIDTTGSMGYVIAAVRTTAKAIVDARLGTDEEPLQYVLAPFNDPGTGPVSVSADATKYKDAISGLYASGGGDCPEYAITGIYDAVAASDEGGDLFLFTDASAKDGALVYSALGLAKARDIQIYPILFGSCSPIDPAYIQLAKQTGGQVFFLNTSEAGTITQLADLTVRNNAVQILSVVDRYATPRTYDIPVDSSLTALTVSVSSSDQATPPSVTLIRPDGTAVAAADPGTWLSLSRAVIISEPNPAVGTWRLTVASSAGDTYVNVSGVGTLDLRSFRFADVGGQGSDQGLFSIAGSPLAGQPLYAMASLTAGFGSATITLRRKDFTPLQTLSLETDETDHTKLFGRIVVPRESFLAYAQGQDEHGNAFQRVVPVNVTPQSLAVSAPAPQDLRPGEAVSLIYQAKNLGAAGIFNFSVADDKGFVSEVSPTSISLGTGASANIVVKLMPPAETQIGLSDTLNATLLSTTDASVYNTADLTLFVTGVPQVKGKPNFLATITQTTRVASGIYNLDLRFTNTGPGTAKQVRIAGLTFRTLAGTGTVTYNSTLAPAFPFVTPNVDVGSYFTVRLTLNVPPGVQRFSVTETGTVVNTDGASFALSQAQAQTIAPDSK